MERKKRRVRLLFAGLCTFLVAQTVLILFLGEPWPSISFPRFAGPGGQTQTFTVTQPDLTAHFKDGAQAEVEVSRFLSMIPRSHHSAVLGENYRPVSAPQENTSRAEKTGGRTLAERIKEWAANTLRSPSPNIAPARTKEGKQWTRERLEDLFKGQCPTRFVVEWQEVKYVRSGDDLIEKGKSLVDKISIDL